MSLRLKKPSPINDGRSTSNAVTAAAVTKSDEPSTSPSCCAASLVKLKRKLKRQGKLLLAAAAPAPAGGRKSSFKCRYDPLSYSLNFDGGACGTVSEDEDHYLRFYAFSSRFAANKRLPSRETLTATSH